MIFANANQHNQFKSASHVLTGHYFTTLTTGWIEHGYETTPTSINMNLTSTRHDVYTDYSNKDFYRVPLKFMSGYSEYNSYILSQIRTDISTYDEYNRKELDSPSGRLFMHEFGHSLQEKYYGKLNYNLNIAPTSGLNYLIQETLLKNTFNKQSAYDYTKTEIEANTLSYIYFGFPTSWKFKYYPIDIDNLVHYIDMVQKIK